MINHSFSRFLGVGMLNTIIGYGIMLGLYNLMGVGYWNATAAANFIGALVSYFLNRSFSFRNRQPILQTAPKFFAVISISYFAAYWSSAHLAEWLLFNAGWMEEGIWQDNVAMILGMVLYTAFNYLGQRYYAFRNRQEGMDKDAHTAERNLCLPGNAKKSDQ